MADSDDEYDRRRRDKFRRERSDYDRSRERDERRRDDWSDRWVMGTSLPPASLSQMAADIGGAAVCRRMFQSTDSSPHGSSSTCTERMGVILSPIVRR